MLIQPNTNVVILKNCPLDSSYEHTIYFDPDGSVTEQSNYFLSLKKFELTKQSYQRYDIGVIHVQINAEKLYDCNYLMFQNESFGSKWFYAFITSIEYVNNVSSKISYEIDVMQTWWYDYTLHPCFVEREHSATDELFENIVPENLECGDEYVCSKKEIFDMSVMNVCILHAGDYDKEEDVYEPVQGRVINGVYTPLDAYAGASVYDTRTIDILINRFVESGNEDRIVNIYQYPSFMGDAGTSNVVTQTMMLGHSRKIDGHTPRNKKLFSYPYSCVLVSNNSGKTATFRWENWYKKGITIGIGAYFNISGTFMTSPTALCYPTNYRGIEADYDSGLVLDDFPECPWVGDTYSRWLAQNKNASAVSMTSSAISAGLSVASMGIKGPNISDISGVVNSVSSIAGIIAKRQDLKNTPPQVHGQTQCSTLNAGLGRVGYHFYDMTIKREFAEIIDDYFDRYGYATRKNKIPNRNVRPHWTFTKTVGCTITGSVPADDLQSIIKIYDNGITFWNKDSEVGNYAEDNSPVVNNSSV